MIGTNSERTTYSIVNQQVWDAVNSGNSILTSYEEAIGYLVACEPATRTDLFNKCDKYHMSQAQVSAAINTLVDLGLVKATTTRHLIPQSIKGTMHIDPTSQTMCFKPEKGHFLTNTGKSLFILTEIDFNEVDFDDTNIITPYDIGQPILDTSPVTLELEHLTLEVDLQPILTVKSTIDEATRNKNVAMYAIPPTPQYTPALSIAETVKQSLSK